MLILGLLLLPLNIQGNAVAAGVATIIAAAVSGTVSYLTKRSGDQATVKVSEITTRGDIEQAAFERAEKFLNNTIVRQDQEIHEQSEEIADLKGQISVLHAEVEALRAQVAHSRRTGQRLARGVYELRRAVGDTVPPDPALDQAVVDMLADDPTD